MSDPVPYFGWAKPPGGIWTRIDASKARTRAECWTLLMTETELKGGWPAGCNFMILPEGATPQQQTGTYRDRMMRPSV